MSLIIETDDLGQLTLSPEVLGHAEPHARYEVESDGCGIRVVPISAIDAEDDRHKRTQMWLTDMRRLAKRFAETSTTERSAVDILSEMRR